MDVRKFSCVNVHRRDLRIVRAAQSPSAWKSIVPLTLPLQMSIIMGRRNSAPSSATSR